jgi:putative DNA-invertase from lambdoid prophage Rac
MRIALYARVSTRDQDLQLQLQSMREYAAARGWQITKVRRPGVCRRHGRTTGRARLLVDARRRRLDHVMAWKLDRPFPLDPALPAHPGETRAPRRRLLLPDPGDRHHEPTGRLLLTILAAVAVDAEPLGLPRSRAGAPGRSGPGDRALVDGSR